MSKILASGLCALFVTLSSLAYAQTTPLAEERADAAERVRQLLSLDWKTLTDMRIGAVKAALQLRPDQENYWPPIEQAVRDRAAARHQRLENLAARLSKQGEDPIAIMRDRANTLSERAEGLKKLADAWQPLYGSLDPDQKQRLRFVAAYILHELQEAAESRDEDEDEIVYHVPAETSHSKIYPIHFSTGSAALDAGDQETIRSVASMMQHTPTLVATIIGKADAVGSDEYNKRLSQQRAEAVFEALVYNNKVEESRVELRWTGERLPTAPTGAEMPELTNRVAEITVR